MKFPNLKLAMDHRRCTQFMLADVLKISEPTFSRKIRGRAEFLPHEKCRIADALGYNVAWLFTEYTIPASARRETATLTPAAETRSIS